MIQKKMTKYSIGELAKKLGKATRALRNWEKRGISVAKRTPTNQRYYTEDQFLEFCGREGKNTTRLEETVRNKTVLITGGTGTLGHALTRRLKDYAKKIIIYSRCELKQASMQQSFIGATNIRYLIGDVRDKNRLRQAMQGADVCIHAAALKRIEVNTYNPFDAVKTNVLGSMNVLEACLETDVRRAIMVSTDKASSPATLYGATKYTAESMFVNANNYAPKDKIVFSAVRYGNIYGSNGSIRHLFEKQAEEQNEITITHPEMTRFFMSVDDSVDLILTAIHKGLGGDVFVPKMKAIRISRFVEMFFPGVPVRIIGLRGHEKIHEELISETESRYVVDVGDRYYKIIPPHVNVPGIGWDINYPQEKRCKPFVYRSDRVEELTKEEIEGFENENRDIDSGQKW